MKLIDRYVVYNFLRDYIISFLVLVGMYVVLDMIFNFDELVEIVNRPGAGAPPPAGMAAVLQFLRYAGDFYFYQTFLFFAHLSGMIPVVAASFTLMRMVRFNELIGLLSAGVPLLRVAAPIIITALMLNSLVWMDQEWIIPRIVPKLVRKHDWGSDSENQSFRISAMRDERNRMLFAGRYFPAESPPRMEYVSIVEVDSANQPVSHIRADRALWDAAAQQWKLDAGRIEHGIAPGTGPVTGQPLETYKSNITPEEIQLWRSGDFVEMLSTQRINELLRKESYGRYSLLRVKHTRGVAQILLNMVMLLLAISTVLTREPQHLKMAATRCVMLCGACMSLAFAGQQLAGELPLIPQLGDKWPALMAWLPIFVFGPLSIWLMDRVKT